MTISLLLKALSSDEGRALLSRAMREAQAQNDYHLTVPVDILNGEVIRDALIYGLIDPFTREIRYVGQTTQPLGARLYQHLSDASPNDSASVGRMEFAAKRKCVWIRSVMERGKTPEIMMLDKLGPLGRPQRGSLRGDRQRLHDLEISWITALRYLGVDLTNRPESKVSAVKASCWAFQQDL